MKMPFTQFSLKNVFLISGIFYFSACNPQPDQAGDDAAQTIASGNELVPLSSENAVEVLTAYAKEHPDSIAVISTRHGDIKVRLYKDTPLHRANFVRLAKAGFYDQGEFYRVLKGFAIQGGDSDNRTMKQGAYRIPQEFNPKYIHKKGALAMARYGDERNPEQESSSHNFYIVQGEIKTLPELQAYEKEYGIKYTPEQIEQYLTIGGEPSLDSKYTVFGEVTEGLNVVDSIAAEPVESNWPKKIVKHTIKVL